MKDNRFLRAYAALRSGVMKSNVIEEYFPFFASIIIENKLESIDDDKLTDLFVEKYGVEISVMFVRQVLSFAVSVGYIIQDKGKFYPDVNKLSAFCIDESEYQSKMQTLIDQFSAFCEQKEMYYDAQIDESVILEIIDHYDHYFYVDFDNDERKDLIYSWYSYAQQLSEEQNTLYDFISALYLSAAVKDALFFSDIADIDYTGLNVYLDSPMIFALLGVDTPERHDAYSYLVNQIIQAGCSIYVFEHNYQEVLSILDNAAGWAISADYDMSKASKSARFFHDNQKSEQEITEFVGDIETVLNNLGITVKSTPYDFLENRFQEDENKIYQMIEDRYINTGRLIQSEIEQSIRTDVRSIVMIYRARGGSASNIIPQCKHIMLTTNNLIANVSKNYESSLSMNPGHIPACISADFFGAVLWLNSPAKMLNYQKKKLLADCYLFRQPTQKMIKDYIKTIEKARDSGEIDDKKFIFLRSHPMVRDALMNITKGDYARFSNDTWKEVYDSIKEIAEKKYRDEENAHNQTKRILEDTQEKIDELLNEKSDLENRIKHLEDERLKDKAIQFTHKCNRIGTLLSCIIFGTPYLVLLTVIELIKSQFNTFLWTSFLITAGLLIVPVILSIVFSKCRKWCSQKVRAYYLKKQGSNGPN